MFVFPIICNGCCKSINGHQYIRVNNTDRDIYVGEGTQYPDTLFDAWSVVYNNGGYHVPARLTYNCLKQPYNDTWEANIRHFKTDTLILFIIDADSLIKICTDTLIDWSTFSFQRDLLALNERMVLKRYYQTIDDLDRLDWTITYS